MLELLRQHAEEKITEDVELDQKIRTEHSQYYYRWLTAPETNLLGNGHLGYCSYTNRKFAISRRQDLLAQAFQG
jgi:hypothetical protein